MFIWVWFWWYGGCLIAYIYVPNIFRSETYPKQRLYYPTFKHLYHLNQAYMTHVVRKSPSWGLKTGVHSSLCILRLSNGKVIYMVKSPYFSTQKRVLFSQHASYKHLQMFINVHYWNGSSAFDCVYNFNIPFWPEVKHQKHNMKSGSSWRQWTPPAGGHSFPNYHYLITLWSQGWLSVISKIKANFCFKL